LASKEQAVYGGVVWRGKPWVVPAAVVRTIVVFLAAGVVLWLEFFAGAASASVAGVPVFGWTLLVFVVVWLIVLLQLVVVWVSNAYLLRQDSLEVKRGIIRLHSFVVTPAGFGDLSVFQSLGGRIFGYGDVTVNSQGERETKLRLVKAPFRTADVIREVMAKPLVRVADH
jgi:uncharacterized membrane protein YdbT with pleckstrin-like domain